MLVVCMELLRRHRRDLLLWGAGLGLLAFAMVTIVPGAGFLEVYQNLVELLAGSAGYEALLGEDLSFAATPEGYLAGEVFSWLILLYAFYAVVRGLDVSLNDEHQGRIDVVLATPVRRWQVILGGSLAVALLLAGLVLATLLGLVIGNSVTATPLFRYDRLIAASANLLPASLFVLGLTVMTATLLRQRARIIALLGAVVAGSFVLNFLAGLVSNPVFDALRVVLYYRYYDPARTMEQGLQAGNIAVLLGVTAVMLVIAVLAFDRREIAA
jgi:ABC-2 type transport system permease protein